jgi:hypothetical protein
MTRLVNAIIGVIETAFAVRVVLQLFGASPTSPFVLWLYGITDRLAAPFAGAFPVWPLGGDSVIDLTIILAMVCYALLGWLIVLLISFVFGSIREIYVN